MKTKQLISCCTEIVSNRDPRTEVRTEPWYLCTVPPLLKTHLTILSTTADRSATDKMLLVDCVL